MEEHGSLKDLFFFFWHLFHKTLTNIYANVSENVSSEDKEDGFPPDFYINYNLFYFEGQRVIMFFASIGKLFLKLLVRFV